MASRASKTELLNSDYREYKTSAWIDDVEVVIGISNPKAPLPDYSHSPNAIYGKYVEKYGLNSIRIYKNHEPVVSLEFHIEPSLGGQNGEPVLHIHEYGNGRRGKARLLTERETEIYDKYIKMLYKESKHGK